LAAVAELAAELMEGGLVKQSEILESHRFGIRTRIVPRTQRRADISTPERS